ncbi:MAG TPA: phosphatidate cytidylyltransferase, partial [Roseimicrobium sp.]|nr:phosphatidate cytidylyltransferase [Roseimicrobium sp.]
MSESAATPPVTPPSKGKVFLRRLTSSVILWTVVLSALFSKNKLVSDYVFLLIMMVLAGIGLMEFYNMVEKRGLVCFKPWGVFGGLLLMASTFFYLSGPLGVKEAPAKAGDFETSILVIFVLGLCVRQFVAKNNAAGILAISTTLFGLMYVPWLLNFIQKINFFPHIDGHFYILYFILVTKFS